MDTVTQDQIDHVRNGASPEGALLAELHFYTTRQAREYLGVSTLTFDTWVKQGHVPVTRFHEQRYLTSDQLRIAARHAKASYAKRGKLFQPRELGEPVRFEVEG